MGALVPLLVLLPCARYSGLEHGLSLLRRLRSQVCTFLLSQKMCRKFKADKDAWLKYLEFKMRIGACRDGAGRSESASFLPPPALCVLTMHPPFDVFPPTGKSVEGRQVLKRALRSLPRFEHVDAITKFGIMEFKMGDAERGRTIFEQVLAGHPKRADLWSVFVDQEMRLGNEDIIRALFERIITLPFNAKKMKYFFKRYLAFEQEHGTAQHVEHVKDKARAFVSARA